MENKVYSLNLTNKDFIYEIEYNNGSDDLTLCTNDEAKETMNIAVVTLEVGLKKYFKLDGYNVDLSKITFAADESKTTSFKFSLRSLDEKAYPIKRINCNASFPGVTEKNPTDERIMLGSCIEGLLDEVEKYLRGERAQGSLDI